MRLTPVIGSSGSGKTFFLYQSVIEEAKKNKDKNFLIIVPEQYTMSTQRMLVRMSENHCIMNIDVLSFNRLAYRVFAELGISSYGILDDMGKSLVLRKLVENNIDKLIVLKKNMTRLSYITQVKSLISELTQYNITPALFSEMMKYDKMSESFKQKAKDFLVLYEAFLEFIDGKYLTTESLLAKLNEVLGDSTIVRDSVIVLDGFTGFTPIQYQLVEHFLSISEQVYVSITADFSKNLLQNHEDSDLFKMSSDFMKRLNHIAVKTGALIDEPVLISGENGRHRENEVLKNLESHLFRNEKPSSKSKAFDVISLLTLKNPRQELRYAAIKIREYIQKLGLCYGDFAIVTPNLEQYRYNVSSILREYDIPFFIDAKTEIVYHPFVEAIRAIFDMYSDNFDASAVFRFLKTGITDLSRKDIDIFERYIISTGIRGKKKYFHPFVIRSNTFSTDEQLVEVNTIRQKFIEPFMKLDSRLSAKDLTVKDIAISLYQLIVSFECEKKIAARGNLLEQRNDSVKAKEYSQIYKVVMDIFDKMVAILGDEVMELDEFSEIFEAGLSAASIGVIPPKQDSVIIGDMERTRLDHIKVLFLVGASDDAIPQKLDNGGILSQFERELLLEKYEMAPSDRQKSFRQKFYLYLMLTKPEQKLVITSPRTDAQGKGVNVSYLMETIKQMFLDLEIKHLEGFSFDEQTLSKQGALELLIKRLRQVAKSGNVEFEKEYFDELTQLLAWAKQDETIDVDALIEGVFYSHVQENISKDVMALINDTFNANEIVTGSVSKFELYSKCSFAYFLNYVMRLKELEQFELSSIDMGDFYHFALSEFGELIKATGKKWHDLTDEETTEFITIAIQKTFEQMGKVASLEDPTQSYIVETMKKTLLHTVLILTEQIKRSSFEPALFEESIDTLLQLKDSDTNIAKLIGKVDRIDIAEDTGSIRIIDYKSSKHSLDVEEIYYGLSLQLPIYMNAVIEKLKEEYKDINIHPSAMLYYCTKNPFIERKEQLADLNELKLKQSKLDGFVSSDELEVSINDNTISREDNKESSVVPVKYTKDGFAKTSHILSDEQLQLVIDYSKNKAARIAKEIIDGNFDPNPFSFGEKSGCTYCKFKGVCHFDEKVEGFNVNECEPIGEAVFDAMKKQMGYLDSEKKGEKLDGMD